MKNYNSLLCTDIQANEIANAIFCFLRPYHHNSCYSFYLKNTWFVLFIEMVEKLKAKNCKDCTMETHSAVEGIEKFNQQFPNMLVTLK